MKDIKQDLQKKISSYQTLLKKTYGDRTKAPTSQTNTSSSRQVAKNNEVGCRPV
jgi:hypothetical protein